MFQDLAGLEAENAALGDDDRIARLGVAALTLALVSKDEVSEAGDLDLLSARQGLLHRLEDEVDKVGGFLLREATQPTVDDLNDVRLRHRTAASSPSRDKRSAPTRQV